MGGALVLPLISLRCSRSLGAASRHGRRCSFVSHRAQMLRGTLHSSFMKSAPGWGALFLPCQFAQMQSESRGGVAAWESIQFRDSPRADVARWAPLIVGEFETMLESGRCLSQSSMTVVVWGSMCSLRCGTDSLAATTYSKGWQCGSC